MIKEQKKMPDGLEIAIQDKRWRTVLPHLKALTRCALGTVLDLKKCSVSVVFADNDFVQQLNRDYRHKDAPTNVLSFPMPEMNVPMHPMGDIVLAYETVLAESKAQGKTLLAHLTHLLIHGGLHLSGYDHISEQEAVEMETLEIEKLKSLGYENPYQTDE